MNAIRGVTWLLLPLLLAVSAYGLGQEEFGNAPLGEPNYADWPGIMPTINHESRVYNSWVNGNEYFCYRGDEAALNEVLARFAQSESPVREVFVLPGEGVRKTFDGVDMHYDWMLHILGGISRAVSKEAVALDLYPTLTIYPRNLSLKSINLPDGITVLDIHDLRDRYAEALQSEDQEVRGYVASLWASADPYNPAAASSIADLLQDPNGWVQSMAALSLGRLGTLAAAYLESLKTTRANQPDDAQIQEVFGRAIESIERSEAPAADAVDQFERETAAIHEFVQRHRVVHPSSGPDPVPSPQ
ncbi:MAG: hypothetical protein AMXMBFR82_49030 [Candidatus Hydrogenedentota bacterium]